MNVTITYRARNTARQAGTARLSATPECTRLQGTLSVGNGSPDREETARLGMCRHRWSARHGI